MMDGITIHDAILYALDKWRFIGFTAAILVLVFTIGYPLINAAWRLKRERDAEKRRRRFDDRLGQ